jgi:hypothetical protein
MSKGPATKQEILKNLPTEQNKKPEETNMADFVQSTVTKSAVRNLAEPIADVATFNSIVQSVITDNPFACVAYMTAGENHNPVEKTREGYIVKIVYQDAEANTVGNLSDRFTTIAGFNAGAAAILANTALATSHGGTPYRDTDNELYSATLKCHDPSGEVYMVSFSRQKISITSYSDDGIRTKVETWADTVPALA